MIYSSVCSQCLKPLCPYLTQNPSRSWDKAFKFIFFFCVHLQENNSHTSINKTFFSNEGCKPLLSCPLISFEDISPSLTTWGAWFSSLPAGTAASRQQWPPLPFGTICSRWCCRLARARQDPPGRHPCEEVMVGKGPGARCLPPISVLVTYRRTLRR